MTPSLLTAFDEVPAHLHFVEYEFSRPAEGPLDYRQVWFALDEEGWIWINTQLDQLPTTLPGDRVALDTSDWTTSWSEVFRSPTFGGVTAIAMQDNENFGWVEVRGYRVDPSVVERVAATIRPAGDGAYGWVSPALEGFEFFAAGGSRPAAFRSLIWSNGDNRAQAEVRVSTNSVDDFLLAWPLGLTPAFTTIGDRPAILVESGSRWDASWMLDDITTVTAGLRGTEEQALAFFESVAPIDRTDLDALVEPIPEVMSRGCQSMWC